jgi:predicted  nucleic acid-binding Zn-ribbon protein
MSRSANLYALQQIDHETDSHRDRLAVVNESLGETGELQSARQRLKQAQETLSQWRTKQRDQELVLQSLDQKRQASEQRLYGGKIRNPKELSDLQEEVASLGRRRASIEDELLETMVMVEEGEAEEREASESLRRTSGQWERDQAELQVEKETLESRLLELSALRQQRVASIPPVDLKSYEHLRPRKRGVVVAILQGDECQGCMTTVSAARVKEARSDTLAYCGTCGRILHVIG